MKITLGELDNAKLIVLAEDLDAAACEQLTPLVESLPDAAAEIVLDLSAVPFVDSSGIGLLIFMFKRLMHSHVPLCLICPPGQPKSMLSVLRIDRSIPCFVDQEAYLAYRLAVFRQAETDLPSTGCLH